MTPPLLKQILISCLFTTYFIAPYNALAVGSGFQRFIANTRVCLKSADWHGCLPTYFAETIRYECESEYTSIDFVNYLQPQPEIQTQLKSCFAETARAVESWSETVMLYGDHCIVAVSKIEGRWQIEQFLTESCC